MRNKKENPAALAGAHRVQEIRTSTKVADRKDATAKRRAPQLDRSATQIGFPRPVELSAWSPGKNRSPIDLQSLPPLDTGQQQRSAVGPLHAAPSREKSDNYPAIVARLNSHWRVIECRNGIQWILQKRKGQHQGQPVWHGRRYCRTRAGLLTCIGEVCGPVDDEARAIVLSLPERIGGRA